MGGRGGGELGGRREKASHSARQEQKGEAGGGDCGGVQIL